MNIFFMNFMKNPSTQRIQCVFRELKILHRPRDPKESGVSFSLGPDLKHPHDVTSHMLLFDGAAGNEDL